MGALLLALLAAMTPFVVEHNLAYAQTADSITVEYAENGTGPVATLTATDPEMDMVTWSLSGGADRASFGIDANDGVLTFNSPPDYEGGTTGGGDSDNDNTYVVEVTATDTAATPNTDTFTVNVKVTNVNEPGKVTWTIVPASGVSATNVVQFQIGAVLTAAVTDGDVQGTSKTPTNNLRWQWYRGNSAIGGANAAEYTVDPVDRGSRLRVTAFYGVSTTAREESASLTSDYPVLATKIGTETPEFASSTVSRDVNEGEKGMMVGAPVTATGGHGVLNYTLAGTDVAKFKIDQKTGQITTMVDLDRETTTDADPAFGCGDTYQCSVTVTATDAAGAISAPVATVTITLKNVDDKPVFVTDGTGPPVANSPTGIMSPESRIALFGTDGPVTTAVGVTYGANDPDGDRVNLSLMGADSGLFRLMGTGVLSFKTAPDYEMPSDANGDNIYEVTVRASDGVMYADRMVRVSVTNANEGPEIMGNATVEYAENGTGPVAAALTATDPEMDTVTWSLSGGADRASFGIDANDGVLTFNSPPDYEGGTTGGGDSDNDNTYVVEVTATDTAATPNTDTFTVNVKVTNVNEPGKVTWTIVPASGVSATNVVQFQIGAVLTAAVTDGDVQGTSKTPTNNLRWQWYRGNSAIGGANAAEYTVDPVDRGSRLRVTAFYGVSTTAREESASLTSDYPVLATKIGTETPEFASSTVSRDVNEGEKGMMVGAPVTATGGHGVLNYTLAGTDVAKFKIDQKTGQITTMVDLDRETTTDADPAFGCGDTYQCSVTVTATDAAGAISAPVATVTITLKNVDDKPVFVTDGTGPPVANSPTGIMSPESRIALFGTDGPVTTAVGVTYGANDPDGDRVNLSLMGADSGLFRLMGTGVLSFKTAPDYEMPSDANGDNMYEVTVRASDGTMYADKMVVVSVTGINEAPMITAAVGTDTNLTSLSLMDNNGMDVALMPAFAPDTTEYTAMVGSDVEYVEVEAMANQGREIDGDGMHTLMDGDNTITVTVSAREAEMTYTVVVMREAMSDEARLRRAYDANGDGSIDGTELNNAIDAYLAEDLSPSDMNILIDLYLEG